MSNPDPQGKVFGIAVVTSPPPEGEVPLTIPPKINPQIPDEAWELMQKNAMLATQHIAVLLRPEIFSRLNPTMKAKVLDLALTRAYGANDGSVSKRVNEIDKEARPGLNELSSLARRVKRDLPEFKAKERVVPLRRSGNVNGGD